ncbi:hypothetical protein BDV09DRAFT_44266 [Aspergillus tetrazonus]
MALLSLACMGTQANANPLSQQRNRQRLPCQSERLTMDNPTQVCIHAAEERKTVGRDESASEFRPCRQDLRVYPLTQRHFVSHSQ